MSSEEFVFLLLLIASPAAAILALLLFVRGMRRRNPVRALPASVACLALATWLSPFVQARLDGWAQQPLCERMAAYEGRPLADLARDFGEGRGDGIHAATYRVDAWYAFFGNAQVRVYASPPKGVFHVHVDD